jgi:hypothetical protein
MHRLQGSTFIRQARPLKERYPRVLIVEAVRILPTSHSAPTIVPGSAPLSDDSHGAQTRAADSAPPSFLRFARSNVVAHLVVALAVGGIIGAVTEWAVPHLPFSLEPLSNTAAPWILVSFAVALVTKRLGESLVLAVVTLLALVLGFYMVEAYRGWPVSGRQVVFWFAASMAVGPLVGLAAHWTKNASRTTAALGAGVLGGLVAGEALYGLTRLQYSTPTHYWYVQFTLGIVLALGLTLWRSRRHLLGSFPGLAVSLAACFVVGLSTLVVYQVP